MIVVGFSATDGTTGMIEASTTRSPSIPLTAPCESTTAHGSWGTPHRRCRGRVAVRSQVGRDHVCELVVPDGVAGHDLDLDELRQRRIAPDLAGQLHAFEHPARVPPIGEVVAVDLRLLARVAASQGEGSSGIG